MSFFTGNTVTNAQLTAALAAAVAPLATTAGLASSLAAVPGTVKSVNRYTNTIAAGSSADTTITAVNTAKSVIIPAGFGSDNTLAITGGNLASLSFLNGTTVRGTRQLSIATSTVTEFAVVEYF